MIVIKGAFKIGGGVDDDNDDNDDDDDEYDDDDDDEELMMMMMIGIAESNTEIRGLGPLTTTSVRG